MKKSDIVLIVSVIVIIIISAFVSVGKPFEKVLLTSLDYVADNDEKEDDEDSDDKEKNYYISIDYDDYEDLLDSEDYFFIAIGSTGCGFCDKYKPVLEEVANNLEVPLHYIDLADLDEDEIEELSTSNDYLMENEWGTPTTLILNKEEVVASFQGYIDEEELEDFLEKYVKFDGEE